MIKVYGENNGFGWKMHETVGAQIVQVPMSTPIAMADTVFRRLMLTLVGIFAVILSVLNLILNLLVVRPITRLSRMAASVSRGDLNVPEVKMDGQDEVSNLAGSFNLMRISLVKALGMLDDD